jgi:uncharacterized protein YndB with AHSA1/START domain
MAEQQPPGEPGLMITRIFDAPREQVWREWTTPEAFADWFGGAKADVPAESVSMDMREGGRWKLTMIFDGREIHWHGSYLEVTPPERLVMTITDRPEESEEVVTVDLVELDDGRTEMRMSQRGGGLSPAGYRRAREGWGGFFDRLQERLRE